VTAGDRAAPNGTVPAPQPKRHPEQILHEARWDGKLARARAHVAIVVVYHSGEHQVIWPHERTRVRLHRRPATVYEVDLGIHQARIEEDLPSQGHSGSFHAKITVDWRVLDPSAIVRHQVLDIRQSLYADLLHRARGIAREFTIDQITDTEEKINAQLQGIDLDVTTPAGMQQAMQKATELRRLGAKYGLWTSAITHLTLDDAATEHNTKMRKLKWALEEEEAEHRLRMIKNKNEQEIMAEKIAVYREIIATGDVERFALRLANHPDEISAVTEIIREDQLTSRQDTIDFIKHMVDSGVVERWEVSDQVSEALEWLRDATARVVTDKHHRTAEIEASVRQRRRGRGEPIEQSAASEPSPDIIVMSAETVPPKPDTGSKSSANADGIESEPLP
jgi:hypothetical protein